ncbi:MAG: IS630 family transposase [Methanotrichaceae archaeon]|nr:IS630 family transposase [Methanotrichaceae archaeon]
MVGFLDETSPQTTANTQRLLSFDKPIIYKNTTKLRSNAFGFYALNGTSVIDFKEHSKKEDVYDFLKSIRSANPDHKIVIILDNFRSHRAKKTILCAIECQVQLAFLPPYSHDLNPIEFIWKSIKRVVSSSFIRDVKHMRDLIGEYFMAFSAHLTYAKRWKEVFLKDKNIS